MNVCHIKTLVIAIMVLLTAPFNLQASIEEDRPTSVAPFNFQVERFADIKILRYRVPHFDALPVKRKVFLYYLYQASLSGRDIIYDQNYEYNLTIRRTLEEILKHYKGDRMAQSFKDLVLYAKLIWFSNGIHLHTSNKKILPRFLPKDLTAFIKQSPSGHFPTQEGEHLEKFIARIIPIIFDPEIAAKKVNRNKKVDRIQNSAINFYRNISAKEVSEFYKKIEDASNAQPIMHGLNSILVKENGIIKEKVWKLGGIYSAAIEKIIYWLNLAIPLAENEQQRITLEKLVAYYTTGDLRIFDEYSIAWVKDTFSDFDFINGFIEVYSDPEGMRGSYESIIEWIEPKGTKRIEKIAQYAQWFEDQAPIMPQHKKDNVVGITARSVNVVLAIGDASPALPVGINLPNSDWIRAEHGSKSVNLNNIVEAHNKSTSHALREFAYSEDEIAREKSLGTLADLLHTDLHEVVGHASGKIEPGVGQPSQTLKPYASSLEEARADIFALYFIMDPKLEELGIVPKGKGFQVGQVAYDQYIRNGLLIQLRKVKLGSDLEQAHMRNRHMIAKWAYEQGKGSVIEKVVKNDKTYFVIKDYLALRQLFGRLLKELQRIKSQGDLAAGKQLIEKYGVKLEPDLHAEVLTRYQSLNAASYSGFMNPKLVPVYKNNDVIDVKIEYPNDFMSQMLEYGAQYSFLPSRNV